MSSALLLNERFVAVFPSLVRALDGLTEAAVLQEIHYQTQTGGKEHAGNIWVPRTVQALADALGLSAPQVTRATAKLGTLGVLVKAHPEAFQRRTWWRIDYEALDHLAKTANGNDESAKSQVAKIASPNDESASSTSLKKNKNNTELVNPTGATVTAAFVDEFRRLHQADPDRQLISRIGRDAKRMLAEGRTLEGLVAAAQQCAKSGHGNLPAAYTSLLAKGKSEPRGFSGIREFLEDLG